MDGLAFFLSTALAVNNAVIMWPNTMYGALMPYIVKLCGVYAARIAVRLYDSWLYKRMPAWVLAAEAVLFLILLVVMSYAATLSSSMPIQY